MTRSARKCPPYHLISAAANGDERALEKLLQFYDAYISKACLRPLYDDYGNVNIAIDMELKGHVRESMARKMVAFEMEIK